MATIKAGTYRFNDVLTEVSEAIEQPIEFYVLPGFTLTDDDEVVVTDGQTDCSQIVVAVGGEDFGRPALNYDFVELDTRNPVYLGGAFNYFYDVTGNEAFKGFGQTITLPTDNEVSAEFAEWFSANAVEVVDNVQISGKWKFKDVLIIPMADFYFDEQIDFSVAVDYMGQQVSAFCDGIQIVSVGSLEDWRLIYNCITPPFDYDVYVYWNMGRSWEDMFGEGIKTINFGTEPQTVSVEFYNWLIANATQPCAAITHNGEAIASLFAGQTATLKCAGMKMAGDVVVSVAENIGGGDANIVPLTVTENGVYDTYYKTATEVWDNNTEYAGSVTVDGVTLNFKKAEHLIVPDDLNELKRSSYVWQMDMDGDIDDGKLGDALGITSGVVAAWNEYAVLWVKMAAPLNAQFGISFLEDNTAYITNYLQFVNAAYWGIENTKVSITAPSKKVENVAYRPVTVALPISKDTLVSNIKAGYETQFSTIEYYKHFRIKGPEVQQLTVTPSAVEQTFTADEDKCFKKVTVGAVDLSNLSSMHILCGIYMKTLPQTQYVVGGSLNTIGGVFVAQYTDGSTQEIELTNKVVSGFGAVMNTPGNHMLTVKYAENGINSWATYPITITEG